MISIIIPLYNKASTIKRTLLSIISQDYIDIEIVVIDDGSTDLSCKEVLSINDHRIRLYHQSNKGVSSARNLGIIKSKGKWLLFLDADDRLYRNALSSLMNLMMLFKNAEIYVGSFDTLYKNKKLKHECSYSQIGYINNPFQLIWEKKWNMRLGSFIVRKDCCMAIGGFNQKIIIGEDTHFVKFLLLKYNIAYSKIPMMIYDQTSSSLSHKKTPFYRHIENYFILPKNNSYLSAIEYDLLFKHIFRGLYRFDITFSIELIRKYWMKIPNMIKVELFKYNIISNHG